MAHNENGAPSGSPVIQSRRSIKTTASRWVESADPDLVKALSEEEIQRQEILHELFNTEAEYVKSLSVVIDLFLHPLRERAVLKRHEIYNVFGSFESILAVNKVFLEDLRRCQAAPSSDCLLLVTETFCRRADEFRVYGPYCGLITTLQENVASLQRTNEAFDKFLNETSKRPECKRLLLSDFLIEPLQRLLKYPLLLQSLKKLTSEVHTAHKPIVDAHARMAHVADVVNETTHLADSMRKMEVLETELKSSGQELVIRQNGRKLLRDGVAKLVTAKRKSTDAYLYLFNDMLIVCRFHKGKKRLEKRLPFVSDSLPPAIVLRCSEAAEGAVGGLMFVLELSPLRENSSSAVNLAASASALSATSSATSVPTMAPVAGDALLVQFVSNAEKTAWLVELHNRIRERHDEEVRLSMLVTRLPSPSMSAGFVGSKDPRRQSTSLKAPVGDSILLPPSQANSSGAVNTVGVSSNISTATSSSTNTAAPVKSAMKHASSSSSQHEPMISAYTEFLFENNQRLQKELNRETRLRESLEGYANTLRMRLEKAQTTRSSTASGASSSSATVPRDKYKQLKRKYADLAKEKAALEAKLKDKDKEREKEKEREKDRDKEKEREREKEKEKAATSSAATKPQIERGFSILQMLSPRSSRAAAAAQAQQPAAAASAAPTSSAAGSSSSAAKNDISAAEAEFVAKFNAAGWQPDPRRLPRNTSHGTAASSKAAKDRDAISMRVAFYETLGTPNTASASPSAATSTHSGSNAAALHHMPGYAGSMKRATVAGVSPVPSVAVPHKPAAAAPSIAASSSAAQSSNLGGSIGRGAQRRSGQFTGGSVHPNSSTAASGLNSSSGLLVPPLSNTVYVRAAAPAATVNMNSLRSPSPRPSAAAPAAPTAQPLPMVAPLPGAPSATTAAAAPPPVPGTTLTLLAPARTAASANNVTINTTTTLSPRQAAGSPPVPAKPAFLQLTTQHTLASKQDSNKDKRLSLREPLKEPPAGIRVPNPAH